ncbi:restriction endonuclease subunit S [Streptomyces sp. NPDC002793]|uniref:restriction endonuclease subunit S n=1 Tax=Streptomyces sp. NPDC002793 TaxID=3154432 RepID=UPI00332BE156
MDNENFNSASGLPRLPNGWTYAPLQELLNPAGISYGIVQPGPPDPSGIPIIRVKDIKNGKVNQGDPLKVAPEVEEKHSRTRLEGGEVLITLVGSVGEVAIASNDLSGWNVARAIGVLRLSEHISGPWLKACLDSDTAQHYMRQRLNTTVQATLNLRDVRTIPIVMPPERDRIAITGLIEALDNKIAVNERIAAKTDALASSMFEALLASSEEINQVLLAEVADVNKSSVKPFGEGTLRYVDISSVGIGSYDWPEETSWADAPGRARRKAAVGDTIWSTVRPNRRSHALVLDDDPDLVFSTGLAVLTPRSVGPAFLYEVTRTAAFQGYLESVAEGSAYPAVRADRFKAAPLELPSPEERHRFEGRVMAIRLRAHQSNVESRTLATLRDTLLPQLMSGRLRVRDAEKIVEDHA